MIDDTDNLTRELNEHDKLVLRKRLAADRVVSYAKAVARAMGTGEPLGPSLTDMFLQAVEDHERAREELVCAFRGPEEEPELTTAQEIGAGSYLGRGNNLP